MQAVINGYGGLRLTDAGLKILRPHVPEGVGQISLRELSWRGAVFNMNVSSVSQSLEIASAPQGVPCLTDATGSVTHLPFGTPVVFPQSFVYPGLLHGC